MYVVWPMATCTTHTIIRHFAVFVTSKVVPKSELERGAITMTIRALRLLLVQYRLPKSLRCLLLIMSIPFVFFGALGIVCALFADEELIMVHGALCKFPFLSISFERAKENYINNAYDTPGGLLNVTVPGHLQLEPTDLIWWASLLALLLLTYAIIVAFIAQWRSGMAPYVCVIFCLMTWWSYSSYPVQVWKDDQLVILIFAIIAASIVVIKQSLALTMRSART